jgi:ABC-type phosphate transport system substrate-binding protein
MLGFLMFTASDMTAQQRGGYKIVVNASNSVAALTADQVARLFQKKVTRWDSGQTVVPVDLPEDSQVRERFTQDVYGRSVGAIKGYWQRQIFSGRGVPPVEKASPQEVVTYVSANVNAIGYVPADMSTGPNVKAVRVTR